MFEDLRATFNYVIAGNYGLEHSPCDRIRLKDLIGGARGLRRVYVRYRFEDEKRRALESWARLLLSIVAPRDDNVLPMKRA